MIFRFIIDLLGPLVDGFASIWPNDPPVIVLEVAIRLGMLGVSVLVDLLIEHTPGRCASSRPRRSIERIPAIQLR